MRTGADDEAWLDGIWRRHRPRVVGFLRRASEPNEAEDLAEQTFIEAWRRRAEAPDQPLPWLLRIANQLHRSRHGTPVPWTPLARVDPELAAACAALTDDERACLLLFVLDDLTDEEVAQVVGCDPDTARRDRERARDKLRHAVGGVMTA
ncbi:RNA polymerase sigma factor [Micromonospora sp. CPCC 206061]|uniref:RNA polymerase sigma factor n=1 Tax=Micromonospora sp. CPCC 206061 TaxID=3122410 RepID=UPI002FEEF410